MLIDEDNLLIRRSNGFRVFLRIGDLVACLLREIVEAGLVLIGTGNLFQAAAGKILKAGVYHLLANLIIIIPAGLMGIERGGGGMVEVDGADDADLPILLLMELLGNGLIGDGTGGIHIDHTGVGLVSGSNGGRRGGGVRCEAACVIGNGGACDGEVHKVQCLRAVQHRAATLIIAVAGQCLFIVSIGQCAEVVGCGLELRIAHAVADEQEYILWCLCSFFLTGLIYLTGRRLRHCLTGTGRVRRSAFGRCAGACGGRQQQYCTQHTTNQFLTFHCVTPFI